MIKEKGLIRFITFAPLFIIPAIVITISTISIRHNYEILDQSLQNVHERLISEQEKSIVSKINMAIELIVYQRSTIESRLQSKVKSRVDTAYAVAQNIYEQNKDSKSENEIKRMIIEALRPMVWNNGESFIFILDKEGKFALAPSYLRHLEGKSILDFKDVAGRYVIREEINTVNTKGEGYLWDTFTRPGYDPKKQFKQMAYVKDLGHFNWYMGSTEYLDTTAREIEHSSIDILRNINQNATHYFFIVDKKGNDILHPFNPEYEGKNLYKVARGDQRELFKSFLRKADTNSSEFTRYRWKNPATGTIETKLTFVKTIPNTDWVIGTGFHVEDIDRAVEAKRKELIALNKSETDRVISLSILFSILSIVVSFFVSMRLKRHFEMLHDSIEQHNRELSELNASLEDKIAERTEELKVAHDKMEKIAMTDTLTGIHNRYAFFKLLETEQEKSKRYETQFSMIMFDLDYFKTVNDTYGHDVGDSVLVEVVAKVGECLRKSDTLGRIGGEEFMVLLPHTEIREAVEIAQRIRHFIAEHSFDTVGTMTVSIGVVQYRADESMESFVKRSDIALYQAKELGRNRIEIG
ncbi:MAG: cache domain-containing protein [Sulfuricurvum sp.]|uniref:sensor domain-containing diguanylate cyclase n=1 Tax=Sulfuricurvum sp. TaxID=2025608 RepID=UPI0026211751|nr:cache domain-containing protein [Sulfuricurvum sp.]MDD5118841.1 cache domain-containing protein [Sulfuricurvum sp.]